ncbi:hypothetical protein BDB00DRAFT_874065 [Zychaea mexicana]|uniref:uncharacterized protein n=1 Tax=Zychaea mexicana TaxID=64656 RepID=UPI0022FE0F54|nr:uncharacterized protein BDB00DRAFT_874065 [Zychaea mexicana]KAI9491685.1 hypothetical protein BDB00DRAFT_874065 [Zychaea mexicana]
MSTTTSGITQDEAEIYDRQIRLWGLDAQQRIRNARVLIAGMRALSDEVCKNIALAGVGSITLLDHDTIKEEDLGAQFFLSAKDIGKNRAEASAPAIQQLNPRVNVVVDQDDIVNKPDDFFNNFDIVCLFHKEIGILERVNTLRRKVGKPFYTADAFGWFGYIFCDLVKHTYIEERKSESRGKKSGEEPKVQRTTCVEEYASFEQSLRSDWSAKGKKVKRLSPLSFVIHVLFKFEQDHGRSPTEKDIPQILAQKDKYLEAMGVKDSNLLQDELIKDVVSLLDTEMAPVAAIVGGVLAQEMIKVLSAKELPIQNWFYYSGLDGSGMIHQI